MFNYKLVWRGRLKVRQNEKKKKNVVMECFYPNIIVTLLRFMFSSVPTCFEDVKLLRGMDGLLNGHRCRGSSSPYEVLMCRSHVGSRPNRSLARLFFRVFKFIFDMAAFERVAQSRRKRIPAKQQWEMQLDRSVSLSVLYGGPFKCTLLRGPPSYQMYMLRSYSRLT